MKKDISRFMTVVFFLLTLFLPHVIWPKASVWLEDTNLENRELFALPELTLDGIETYPQAFENYYNDHLPFRNQLIRMYNRIQYEVFRNVTHPNVIIGKENWLFYGASGDGEPIGCYDGSLLLNEEQLRQIADNLISARDELAKHGTEFVLFIAPNKERVYAEYMPQRYGEPQQMCMINQVVSYLRDNTDIRVVYAYDALMEYRNKYDDLNLYYPMDTHWNSFGAYIGARELLKELGVEIPPLQQMKTAQEEEKRGDLAVMLNIADGLKSTQARVDGYGFGSAVNLENEFYGGIRYEMSGLEERRLFIKRDSFCTSMIPYLSSFFSESLFLHRRGYTTKQVLDFEPSVYVLETVERYVPNLLNPVL